MNTRRHGFTLPEVLIATTIVLLVSGAALSVFQVINRSMYGLSDAIDLNARSRLTQDRVLIDLRALTKITQATDQSLTGEFIEYASGRTGELSYYFDSGRLMRRTTLAGEAAKTIAVMDGLQTDPAATTSRFLYRNRTGSKDVAAASASEVRSIQIEFVPLPSARQSAGLVSGRNTPFASALVQLRNIGS